MQFYPGDWRTDTGLRLCSLAAKGLWIEMLCLMWVSPKRGCLLEANGNQIEAEGLAKLVGSTEAEVKQALSDLEAHDVYSTLECGTVYNRRMYRQWKQIKSKQEAGRKGGKVSKPPSRTEAEPPTSASTASSAPASTATPQSEEALVGLPSKPDPVTLKYAELRTAWNELPDQYRTACRGGSPKRLTALRARLKETAWWQDCQWATMRISEGKCGFFGDNDRNWKPNIEWFLKPDSVLNILEGKYDGGSNGKPTESGRHYPTPEEQREIQRREAGRE